MKISPIYLDRLEKALGAQGIKLKRSQLLETAAAAFGYHNSNEFSAAAKRGDLTPPPVKPIGRITLPDGQSVLLVTDALANAPYGIDATFIHCVENERAERIGITPYGHLAFLGDLADQNVPELGARDIAPAEESTFAEIANGIEALCAIDADDLPLALEALSELRGFAQELRAKTGSPQIVPSPAHPLDTNNVVAVGRHTLEWLLDAAQRQADDLNTGLQDGTNDEDGNVAEIERAIEIARARMDSPIDDSVHVVSNGEKVALKLYTGIIDHKHGTNTYAQLTHAGLLSEIADYCRDYWSEISDQEDVPATPQGLDDQQIISIYFDNHFSETLSTGETDIAVTAATLAQLTGKVVAPQPIILNGVELPAGDWIKDVAAHLRDGASADIWYDAHDYANPEDEEDPDNAAVDTIAETQRAMNEAADILEKVATAQPSTVQRSVSIHTPHADQKVFYDGVEQVPGVDTPVWITDSEGDITGRVTEAQLKALGIRYKEAEDDFDDYLPLTEKEYQFVRTQTSIPSRYDGYTINLGCSVLYQGRKFHAPYIGIRWGSDAEGETIEKADAELARIVSAIEPLVKAIGGHVIADREVTDETHEINILVPFDVADSATSVETYFEALDFLINGQASPEAPRVEARFDPQAWFRNHAMSVDPQGENRYDVTFDLLLMGEEEFEEMTMNRNLDELRDAYLAPKWVKDWSGPFTVEIEELPAELFGANS